MIDCYSKETSRDECRAARKQLLIPASFMQVLVQYTYSTIHGTTWSDVEITRNNYAHNVRNAKPNIHTWQDRQVQILRRCGKTIYLEVVLTRRNQVHEKIKTWLNSRKYCSRIILFPPPPISKHNKIYNVTSCLHKHEIWTLILTG